MPHDVHHLRITPCDDERGYWLVSNNRTWFVSRDMLWDICNAIIELQKAPDKEWRNYEEEKLPPMPHVSRPPATPSATLEDLL